MGQLFLCNSCRHTEQCLDFVSVNILFWLRNALPMPNNFWKARKSRLKCKNKNKSSRKGCWISYLQHSGFKLEFIGKIDLPLCTESDIWRKRKMLVSQKKVRTCEFFLRKTVELWVALNQRWQPWKLLHKGCQHVNMSTPPTICSNKLDKRLGWAESCENGQQ